MVGNLSAAAAFLAGLLSFLSPCVLPLISSYLVFISGAKLKDEIIEQDSKAILFFSQAHVHILISTVFFIAGFTSVFIALSILFATVFFLVGGANTIVNAVSGIIVILLGFNIIFNFIPFLAYEKRVQSTARPRSFLGAFIVGLAFGAGWTPCIGPILGSILLMAGQSGQMPASVLYLVIYSFGLGLPFLICAFFFTSFIKYIEKLKKWRSIIRIASGILIIAIGAFIASGRFADINTFFLKSGYAISEWANSGSSAVKLFPAALFLKIALVPFIYRLLKKIKSNETMKKANTIKKVKVFTPAFTIFFLVFILLAIAQLSGLISSAELFSSWLLYIGI